MDQRLKLQELLEGVLGTRNVYFQPPANVQMNYPAIVYQRDALDSKFAGNRPYSLTKRYEVTIIDRDPDSSIPDRVAALPLSSFSRHFVVDNLNHDVYTLYF